LTLRVLQIQKETHTHTYKETGSSLKNVDTGHKKTANNTEADYYHRAVQCLTLNLDPCIHWSLFVEWQSDPPSSLAVYPHLSLTSTPVFFSCG